MQNWQGFIYLATVIDYYLKKVVGLPAPVTSFRICGARVKPRGSDGPDPDGRDLRKAFIYWLYRGVLR